MATATPQFCVRDNLKVTLRKKTAASRLGPSQNYDLCGRAECTAKAHNSCLRKTLHTFWPRKISNNLLFKRTEREDMGIVLVKIRWLWISYALLTRWYALLSPTSIFKSAPRWTPEACKGAAGYVAFGRFVVIVVILLCTAAFSCPPWPLNNVANITITLPIILSLWLAGRIKPVWLFGIFSQTWCLVFFLFNNWRAGVELVA